MSIEGWSILNEKIIVMASIAVLLFSYLKLFKFKNDKDFFVIKILLTIFLFFWSILFFPTAEDAFITYRYSENLSNGLGFVWNPGERVEGYSNFLWMVMVAFFHKITNFEIPVIGRILGGIFTVLTLFTTIKLVQMLTEDKTAAIFAGVLYASLPGTGVYGFSGLESPLFVFIIVSYFHSLQAKKILLASIFCMSAALCRPRVFLLRRSTFFTFL